MSTNYDNVNAVWPENPPAPSPQEALRGARRLVKLAFALGREGQPARKFTGKFEITSGNRRTWTRHGVFYVNPDYTRPGFRGWKGIVHDISHWAGRKLYADFRPHDARHAFIERKLAEHVVLCGWLDGKLKRPEKVKPPIDRKNKRYQETMAALERWQRKEKRARTAIKKLTLRKRYYEKAGCGDLTKVGLKRGEKP